MDDLLVIAVDFMLSRGTIILGMRHIVNRNASCGQQKEEMLRQLREMAKLEPTFNDDQGDIEPLTGFQSLVPEQNLQLGDICSGFEHGAEPTLTPSYEVSAFQWCTETGEMEDQNLPSSLYGSYVDTNRLVPDKDSDIGDSLGHANGGHEGQPCNPVCTETLEVFPKVAARELNSQDRDFALSRYKEKKKTRRYDKHIRYESRKVRAESRTRIKGRFAKMDQ
ncbi:unnamed protein product [Ilex paraguariensis]|uniref:CCT domain-containing protein n=1 Tax=Ilex paraguariensis TaxID=185542 RepID=A0ABC8U7E5_9AQUA